MNQEVRKFVEAFETKMAQVGRIVKINEIEIMFLDQVFGPEFNFNFGGLTAQLAVKDYSGKNRYIDFYYESGIIRIIIEIDGYQYHVEGLTAQQYDDHQERQNDMMISGGWVLLRFTANMIMKKPMVCRRQLIQAIGKCLVTSQLNNISNKEQLWLKQKAEILAIVGHSGTIKVAQVAQRYSIDRKTARNWLQRMVNDGDLIPMRSNQLITSYKLPDSTNLM